MLSPMNEVPDAVVHLVFDHLGPRDLCRASAVCQRWRALNRDAAANQVCILNVRACFGVVLSANSMSMCAATIARVQALHPL